MTYMKPALFAILALGLLDSGLVAQDTTPQTGGTAQQAGIARIAPGTVIPVELTKSIDAKKTKAGDEVVAQVTQDLKTNNGEMIIPKGTKVIGHVTEAQPRSKEQPESEVGIAFDHAVMKSGSEMQVPLSIQAIIAPPSANPANGNGGGYDQPGSGGAAGGASPSSTAGRSSGMGGSAAPPPVANVPMSSSTPADAQSGSSANGRITAQTQGVVGISNLKLTMAASNPTQGSLVSSEKNNVKLESGTLMLLRVNQ
jgi:hypothetical protein